MQPYPVINAKVVGTYVQGKSECRKRDAKECLDILKEHREKCDHGLSRVVGRVYEVYCDCYGTISERDFYMAEKSLLRAAFPPRREDGAEYAVSTIITT